MSDDAPASLSEQRRRLREQLVTQRQALARDLVPGVPGKFPRSFAMRLLTQEPALVARLIRQLVGRRVAVALPAVILLTRALVRARAHPKRG